jgi:hypothetical protein
MALPVAMLVTPAANLGGAEAIAVQRGMDWLSSID